MAACCKENADFDEVGDPGAAPYGNFINYYTFNPPENRLSLIPQTLLQDLGYLNINQTTLMLDVGCNSGELSVALYKRLVSSLEDTKAYGSLQLLGFDLDENLIQRAQLSNTLPQNIAFIHLDITEDAACQNQLEDYLKQHGCGYFHLCVCLAVTMWIHLNHGDTGLLDLLSRLASISEHLLLEAQPWKCYRSAARRLRKLGRCDFDHFKTLKIRGDISKHATEHLEKKCNMVFVQSFGNTTWGRMLLLFKKK